MITKFRFNFINSFLLPFSLALIFALPLHAQEVYLCVWRNPERTMTKIFPAAVDYRTVDKPIGADTRKKIETQIGTSLLPGQRDNFQYFEMLASDGKVIGYIIAGSQKGTFGAIEFVFGLDLAYQIKDIYIQRSREKENGFKDPIFLGKFKGVSAKEPTKLDEKFPTSSLNELGKMAIVGGIKKELTTFMSTVF